MKYIYHAVERWSLSFNMPNNLFQQTFSFLSDSLRDDVSTPPLPPLRRAPVQNPPPLAPSVQAPPVRAQHFPSFLKTMSSTPGCSSALYYLSTAFASYVEYTWVGSRSSSPLFSIPSWNQHDASLMKLPRSTNMAEGWHHGFNSMLSCTHPSMWKFLDALKKEHNLIRMKLVRMRQLEEPERRAAKWIKYDDKIQRLCDSYNRHTSVLEYLKKCANVC